MEMNHIEGWMDNNTLARMVVRRILKSVVLLLCLSLLATESRLKGDPYQGTLINCAHFSSRFGR